jgi:hypothetical protein
VPAKIPMMAGASVEALLFDAFERSRSNWNAVTAVTGR